MTRYLPGDVVARRKGLVMHKGVVTGDGRILHNTPFRGEHVCTESEFRAGKRLYVQRQDLESRQRAVEHADRHGGGSYNLFTNNCEHTVYRATSGVGYSPQLKSWIAGLGLATVAFAVTRHPGVAAAGYALGRRLAGRSADRRR